MSEEKYRLTVDREEKQAALLVLTRTLEVEDICPFEMRCRELLASEQPKLTIDMCGVNRVPSTVITAIVKTHNEASEQGRSLTVCCRKIIARILRQLLGDSAAILD